MLKRLLTPPLVFLAALVFLFEEFLWNRLHDLMSLLARHPAVRRLEARIAALPPYAAMALFLVPLALLEPLKLLCLFFMTTGHFAAGLAVLIAAKLLGTAVVARLFALCRPMLLTVGWFARFHDWLLALRDRLYARLRAMPAWQAAHHTIAAVRASIAALGGRRGSLGRRFAAARIALRARYRVFSQR